MRNEDFEKKLKDAVKLACERDLDFLTQRTRTYPDEFSPEFESRMKHLISGKEKESRRRKGRFWRYILVAAALLLLNAGIVLANEDFRTKVGNLFVQFYEHCIELMTEWTDGNSHEITDTFEKYTIAYIPNGYQKTLEEDLAPAEYRIVFENDRSEQIIYIQASAASSSVLLSQEGNETEIQSIHDTDAVLVSDGEITTLFFEKDDYLFMISAPSHESQEVLVQMAESISVW